MTPHPFVAARITAAAVGSGVALAIGSGPDDDTAASWIHYCIRAAMEARAAVLDDPPEVDEAIDPAEAFMIDLDLEPRPIGFAPGATHVRRKPSGAALTAAANAAATVAFRCCLPQLTSRRRAQAYIACLAVGVQHGFISGKEASSLLYVAQLALSAHPKRTAKARPTGRIN